MRFLTKRVHGVLDYLVSILLIASPWIFDFARGGAETWIPVILGVAAIFYSLMTDYELGISKMISVDAHLALDLWSGILLAASPWLFGFYVYIYLPHLILGILEVGISLVTERTPSVSGHRTGDQHHRHAH